MDLTLLHSSSTPRIELPAAIAAQMRQADIRLTLEAASGADLLRDLWSTDFCLALSNFGADYWHPQSLADAFCVNEDPGANSTQRTCAWATGWHDTEVNLQTAAAGMIAEPAAAATAYRRLQRVLQERGPFAIMFGEISAAIVRAELRGFSLRFVPSSVRYAAISRSGPSTQ